MIQQAEATVEASLKRAEREAAEANKPTKPKCKRRRAKRKPEAQLVLPEGPR